MRRPAFAYRSWVIGLWLLALGFAPAAGAAPQTGRWGPFGGAPDKAFFHSAAAVAPHLVPAGDKRLRPPGCDNQAAAPHPRVTLVCSGKPSPVLFRPDAEAASGGGHSATPIRSPPGHGA